MEAHGQYTNYNMLLGTRHRLRSTKPPQSHLRATSKPVDRHRIGTPKPPQSHPKAPPKPHQCDPNATLKPHQSLEIGKGAVVLLSCSRGGFGCTTVAQTSPCLALTAFVWRSAPHTTPRRSQ